MALDVYYKADIGAAILAGVVLALDTAHAQGLANADYCAGALAMARHTALAFGLPWAAIAADARQALGADCDLLDVGTVRVLENK